MAVAVVASLAVASTVTGCSSGGTSSTGASAAVTGMGGQAVARESGLGSALDLIPDIRNGNVMYTDWSMLGHPDRNDPETASFAGALVDYDTQLKRDLGIRSADARWEVDVDRPSRPPLMVLGFGPQTDLSSLAGRLTRLGFNADGPLFTGPARPQEKEMWAYGYMHNIGIDTGRHLLAASWDAAAVRSVLSAPASPLGRASELIPLLTIATTRLGRIATASMAVGSAACVRLTGLLGVHATPAMLAAVRKQFPGTFTPPHAEITAMAGPADVTAVDAMTFPDQRTAQANLASRSAAVKISSYMLGPAAGITITRTAVAGRVLSFDMTARQPHDFPQLVDDNALGVDICP